MAATTETTTEHAHVVDAALRGDGLHRFAACCDEVGPKRLVELAASDAARTWADAAPADVPEDHRLEILHAIARVHRFEGDSRHLHGEMLAALVRALRGGDVPWAEQAARVWCRLVLHIGEAASAWPQAAGLLERFPDQVRASPVLLGMIATIGSCAGEPSAGELWQSALAHPAAGDDADERRELELEWARCHLMLAGGEPARAMAVLERVRRGLLDADTDASDLRSIDVTLELVLGMTWIGDPEGALALLEDALRRVEPGSEYDTWLHGAGAYAAAAAADVRGSIASERLVERAATDTSMLVLRAVLPARMLRAAQVGDARRVVDAVHAATALDRARPFDPDVRLAWRVHACETLCAIGQHEVAGELLDDLDAVLASIPWQLPLHRVRRDRVAAAIRGTADRSPVDHEARAAKLGARLPDLAVVTRTEARDRIEPIALRLFGPFVVRHGDAVIDDAAWGGRRQARLLLAMLLLHGGTMSIDAIGKALWGDIDARSARARLAPLCNAIRTAIGATADGTGARTLEVRGGMLALELDAGDACDLFDLREAVGAVRRAPARARPQALDAMLVARRMPLADLGDGEATETVRDALEREASRGAVTLASAWEGHPPPAAIIATLRRGFELDPTDGETCAALMRAHAAAGNVPAASEAFHDLRRSLREELGLDPPAALVELHAEILGSCD